MNPLQLVLSLIESLNSLIFLFLHFYLFFCHWFAVWTNGHFLGSLRLTVEFLAFGLISIDWHPLLIQLLVVHEHLGFFDKARVLADISSLCVHRKLRSSSLVASRLTETGSGALSIISLAWNA